MTDFYNVTTKIVRLHKMHMNTKYQMFVCIGSKVKANVKVGYLTNIFYIWP